MHAFRKISEPQPEDPVPKGPKPPLSYKTLIGNNFSQTNSAPGTTTDHPMMIADTYNFKTLRLDFSFSSQWLNNLLTKVSKVIRCPKDNKLE